jgi:acetylornithine deacetylase/succinyl-diaminopimelate desuccinylase-like protein
VNFQHFDAYVDAHADDWLQQLTTLCSIPSVSAQGGPGIAQAADMVVELCTQAGVVAQKVPVPGGPPVVVGQAGSGRRGLMIYNHYDVQPPDPLDEWTSPPFTPAVREGKLYARGVADNKGNLVARLCAVRAYQETMGPLPLRLLFVLEGEEEVGSPHLAQFAQAHADLLRDLDGCVWESGYKDEAERPVVSLGLKGILALELRVRTATSDAHSGYGGLYPNAAWRLVEALNTLRTPDGQVTVDGFMDHVRPPTPDELAMLERIPYDAQAIQQAYGFRGFLGGLTGFAALRRLIFEPTCTINGILGGYTGPGSKTVIPSQAMAKLDFRLVPDLTPALAADLVRQHLTRRGFDDIEVVDPGDGLMPARTDPDALIARTAVTALADVHGVEPVVHPSSPGSGPMYQLCQAYGIPAASFGVGWAHSRVHAPNENVRVADFVEGIKVMGRVLHRFSVA